ncbi:MAG TPA: CHAD domain-containing protein [Acidimicrobiia bacterium]|nr:CHAD domain-containing protein [Acidimicrobiia bacterium]
MNIEPDRQPTIRRVVQTSIAVTVRRYLDNAPAIARHDEPEGVHQARVATRRLRSDFRTFRRFLDRDWADGLRNDLRALTDLLGPVRDLDVLHMHLGGLIEQVPDSERRAAEEILEILEKERRDARSRLVRGFAEPWYPELLVRLTEAGEAPRIVEAADLPAGPILVKLAGKPLRKLRAAVRDLPVEPTAAELHRIRILTKRARYAVEAVSPVGGEAAEVLASSLSELQDVLGEHQDAVVAGRWLRKSDSSLALAAGELIGFEISRANRAAAGWRDIWDSIDGGQQARWLEPH